MKMKNLIFGLFKGCLFTFTYYTNLGRRHRNSCLCNGNYGQTASEITKHVQLDVEIICKFSFYNTLIG